MTFSLLSITGIEIIKINTRFWEVLGKILNSNLFY